MKANCFLLSYSLHLCRTYGVYSQLWIPAGGGEGGMLSHFAKQSLSFLSAIFNLLCVCSCCRMQHNASWKRLMKNNGDQKGNLVLSIFACLYFTDLLNFALYVIFVYHCVLLLLLLLFRALLCKEISARFPYSPKINYLYGLCLKYP